MHKEFDIITVQISNVLSQLTNKHADGYKSFKLKINFKTAGTKVGHYGACVVKCNHK